MVRPLAVRLVEFRCPVWTWSRGWRGVWGCPVRTQREITVAWKRDLASRACSSRPSLYFCPLSPLTLSQAVVAAAAVSIHPPPHPPPPLPLIARRCGYACCWCYCKALWAPTLCGRWALRNPSYYFCYYYDYCHYYYYTAASSSADADGLQSDHD